MEGKLFGVLDVNGNEVVPLEYDSIEFYNKKELEDGLTEDVLFLAEYEGEEKVINSLGVIEDRGLYRQLVPPYLSIRDEEIYYTKYQTVSTTTNGYGQIIEQEEYDSSINFYDKDANLIGSFEPTYPIMGYYQLTTDYFLVKAEVDTNINWVYLCDKECNVIWQEKVFGSGRIDIRVFDNEVVVYLECSSEGKFYAISSDGEWAKADNYYHDDIGIHKGPDKDMWFTLGENDDIYIYSSNDTYKLICSDGTALYEDRYFDIDYIGPHIGSPYRYFFLKNANEEVCAIDKEGRMIADIGTFELFENESKPYFDGKSMYFDKVIAAEDALYIVRENNNGNDIYRFAAMD